MICKHFPHSLFFTVSIVSFYTIKVFNFDELCFMLFSFGSMCCWCHILETIASSRVTKIYTCFFPMSFIVETLEVFKFFKVNFCIWFEVGVQFHSFACGYPVVPAWFIENTISSSDYHFCWKSIAHKCLSLFLDSQFCLLDLYNTSFCQYHIVWIPVY